MSVKKESLGNLSAVSLETVYKCGECLHHKRHAHPHHKEVCTNRGIRAVAIAPKCFTPDVTQITNNSDMFVQLAALVGEYTPKQKRIMLALLKQKPIKQKFKKDLQFGTKVFFHGLGKDYISNYLSGYIMGQTSSGELIITGSPDQNSRGRSFVAYMTDDDNLMTPREWRDKKAELKAAGRVLDPQSRIMPKNTEVAEPMTIDSAPTAWHDKQEKKLKKRRADLTELMVYQVS